MITKVQVRKTLAYCIENLNLNSQGDKNFYSCLPLCVIDSVFSIHSNYSAVENVITRVCTKLDIERIETKEFTFPEIKNQISVREYLDHSKIFLLTSKELAEQIYGNHQRTSSKGILKAEAVTQFLEILKRYKIEYYQDIHEIINDKYFEVDIKSINGQGSGISLKSFFMLTGSNDLIMPDTMIFRFLEDATGNKISAGNCQDLLTEVSKCLILDYPHITPKALDYLIWLYQRELKF